MSQIAGGVESSPNGRYIRFDEKLGFGAYKDVYRSYDSETGREVAWNTVSLKKLPRSEQRRIESETSIMRKIKHPHIIKIFDSWENPQKGEICFTTEIVSSGTLKQYVQRIGKVKLKIIKKWCSQVLNALVYLHGLDPPVIHRDLKCDNIFINGATSDIRLGDFGLSAARDRTYAQSVLGTPEFMAPELYDENYTEKVDIYAFGMVVLEIATGEYPYSECRNAAQIWRRVSIDHIKPEVLRRIRNEDVRAFIELCLLPEKLRLSAAELLQHPFIALQDTYTDAAVVTVDIPKDSASPILHPAPIPEATKNDEEYDSEEDNYGPDTDDSSANTSRNSAAIKSLNLGAAAVTSRPSTAVRSTSKSTAPHTPRQGNKSLKQQQQQQQLKQLKEQQQKEQQKEQLQKEQLHKEQQQQQHDNKQKNRVLTNNNIKNEIANNHENNNNQNNNNKNNQIDNKNNQIDNNNNNNNNNNQIDDTNNAAELPYLSNADELFPADDVPFDVPNSVPPLEINSLNFNVDNIDRPVTAPERVVTSIVTNEGNNSKQPTSVINPSVPVSKIGILVKELTDAPSPTLVHMTVEIHFGSGRKRKRIKFNYDLESDIPSRVATDMVETLQLPEAPRTSHLLQHAIADQVDTFKVKRNNGSPHDNETVFYQMQEDSEETSDSIPKTNQNSPDATSTTTATIDLNDDHVTDTITDSPTISEPVVPNEPDTISQLPPSVNIPQDNEPEIRQIDSPTDPVRSKTAPTPQTDTTLPILNAVDKPVDVEDTNKVNNDKVSKIDELDMNNIDSISNDQNNRRTSFHQRATSTPSKMLVDDAAPSHRLPRASSSSSATNILASDIINTTDEHNNDKNKIINTNDTAPMNINILNNDSPTNNMSLPMLQPAITSPESAPATVPAKILNNGHPEENVDYGLKLRLLTDTHIASNRERDRKLREQKNLIKSLEEQLFVAKNAHNLMEIEKKEADNVFETERQILSEKAGIAAELAKKQLEREEERRKNAKEREKQARQEEVRLMESIESSLFEL